MGDLIRLAENTDDYGFLSGVEIVNVDWLGSDDEYDAVELDLSNGLSLTATIESVKGDLEEGVE